MPDAPLIEPSAQALAAIPVDPTTQGVIDRIGPGTEDHIQGRVNAALDAGGWVDEKPTASGWVDEPSPASAPAPIEPPGAAFARIRASLVAPDAFTPQAARGLLSTARQTGVSPEAAGLIGPALKKGQDTDNLIASLRTAGSGLTSYAAQSPAHAAAVSDDMASLGPLAYILSHTFFNPADVKAAPEYVGVAADAIKDLTRSAGLRETFLGTGGAESTHDETLPKASDVPQTALGGLAYTDEEKAEVDRRQLSYLASTAPKAEPFTPPGWLISVGKSNYDAYVSGRDIYERIIDPDKDVTEDPEWRARHDMNAPAPGEGKSPVADMFHAAARMTSLIEASTVAGPAGAFSLLYTEGRSETYQELRAQNFDHESASDIANLTGFTSAAVGAFTGERLFGQLLPKSVVQDASGAAAALIKKQIFDNPTLFKFVRDAGLNQLHAVVSNVGMAVTQAALTEVAEAAKDGRPLNFGLLADTAKKAAVDSVFLAPLSLYAAKVQDANRAQLYREGAPLRVVEQRYPGAIELALKSPGAMHEAALTYQRYEEQGLKLRSLQSAADLNAAAESVKNSEFIKSNTQEGKRLIRSLIDPQRTQTVFVSPEALERLPQDALASLGAGSLPDALQTGAKVGIKMEDYLASGLHDQLKDHAVLFPGGQTPKEMKEALTQEQAEELYAKQNPDEQQGLKVPLAAKGVMPDAMWTKLYGGEPEATANQRVTPTVEDNEPVPETPKVKLPRPPQGFAANAKSRAKWAESAVAGKPISDLDGLVDTHESLANKARAEGEKLQERTSGALARSTSKAQKGLAIATGAGAGGELATPKSPAKAADRGQAAVKEEVKAGDTAKEVRNQERLRKNNEAMAAAARKAQKEASGIQSFVNDRKSGEARRQVYQADADVGGAHDAVLEALGGKQRGAAAPDVTDAVRALREKGYPFADLGVSRDDIRTVNGLISSPRPLDSMTLPEARSVKAVLGAFDTASSAINKVRLGALSTNLDTVRGLLADHLGKLPDRAPGQRAALDAPGALTLEQKVARAANKIGDEFNQPQTLLFKMGPVGDSIFFDGLVPAMAHEERLHAELGEPLKAIHESLPAHLKESGNDILSPPGSVPNWGLRTRSEVWRLALHLGTETGVSELAHNLGTSPTELLGWVQDNLGRTPAEATQIMESLVKPTWGVFGKLWDHYGKSFEERGIAPPEKLKNQSLVINGKLYEGGYGGRLKWTNLAPQEPAAGSFASLKGPGYQDPSTSQESLRERTGAAEGARPNLAWDGVASSLKAEIHDIAFDPFATQTLKILSDPAIRDLLSNKLGKSAVNQLFDPASQTSWLHTVARGHVADISTASAMTQAISKLQGAAARNAFSLNFKVMAQQLSHIPMAAIALGIDPVTMGEAIAKTWDPERRAWAHDQSQVLSLRGDDFERRNSETLTELTGHNEGDTPVHRAIAAVNYKLWGEMDGFLSHAVWEAAYAKDAAATPLPDHARSVREADKAVQRAMPVQSIYEQSALVRDRSAAGFFYMVRNFPNTMYNLGALNMWNARLKDASTGGSFGPAKAAAQYAGMVMAAEVFGKWISGHTPAKNESDAAWTARRGITGMFYPLMLGPVAEGLASGSVRGAASAASHMTPPSVALLGDFSTSIYKAISAKDPEAAVRAATDVLGPLFNLPLRSMFDAFNFASKAPGAYDAFKQGAGYVQ